MTFELGDRVKVVDRTVLKHVEWLSDGDTGVVTRGPEDVEEYNLFYEVQMDLPSHKDEVRTFPFAPHEIAPEDEDIEEEYEVLDTENVDEYALRGTGYGGAFEFVHKPTGKVLLVTEFVSLDTLLRLVEDHQEGNR